MNNQEFIKEILKRTKDEKIEWNLVTRVPPVIYRSSDLFITACYSTYTKKGDLYLYRYRSPAYDADHDSFYYTENIAISLIVNDQITWEYYENDYFLSDLYDHVSYINSGIDSFFD